MNVATMTTPASHTRDGATADDVVLSAEDVSVRVRARRRRCWSLSRLRSRRESRWW